MDVANLLRTIGCGYLFIISVTIDAQISSLSSPEKIHLQTDKPIYVPGDTLYFSTLLFNATDRSKAPISKVVYVDFISPEDSMVSSRKIYIEDVLGSGDFELSEDLESGSYMIRAYTNFMRNFPEDNFFYQEVLVVTTDFEGDIDSLYNEPARKRMEISPYGRPVVDIRVEGGVLIKGVTNNLVYRISDQNENGIAVEGKLLDERGDPLGFIKTYDYGFGLTSLAADTELPKILMVELNGIEHTFPLNIDYEEGYQIRVVNRGKYILLNVACSPGLKLKGNRIVGISGGKVIYENNFQEKDENVFSTRLITTDLASGAITFLLLDKDNLPIIKRRSYLHSPILNSQPEILLEKEVYKTRENLNIKIKSPETFADTSIAFLTVSVRDMGSINTEDFQSSLNESILIPEKVENIDIKKILTEKQPSQKDLYVLDVAMAMEQAELDTEINSIKDFSFKPEKGILIEGFTSELNKAEKPVKCNMLFDVFGDQFFHEETTTTERGKFTFGPFYFVDTINVILQARKYEEEKYNNKGDLRGSNKVSIWLEEEKHEKPGIRRPRFIHYKKEEDASIDNYLMNRRQRDQYARQFLDLISVDLDEITIKKRRVERLTEEEKAMKKAPGIYSQPSNRIVVDEISSSAATSALDLLRRVPGVTVFGSFPDQSVRIRGASSLTGNNEPFFLLDNIPVDISAISQLSVSEIWFIDVLKGPKAAIFGNRGSSGVISVFTFAGNNRPSNFKIKREPGIADFKLNGFNIPKPFVIPDYKEKPQIIRPDLRTLLYWEPRLILKGKEPVEILLSTCDNAGDYLITVEGMDNAGNIIKEEKILRVR